jgi:hypothetical protein
MVIEGVDIEVEIRQHRKQPVATGGAGCCGCVRRPSPPAATRDAAAAAPATAPTTARPFGACWMSARPNLSSGRGAARVMCRARRGGHAPGRPGAKCTYVFEDTGAWLAAHTAMSMLTVLPRIAWQQALAVLFDEVGANPCGRDEPHVSCDGVAWALKPLEGSSPYRGCTSALRWRSAADTNVTSTL